MQYRKNSVNNKKQETPFFKLTPLLMGIQFDKKNFATISNIKKYICKEVTQMGVMINFDDAIDIQEDENSFIIQLSKYYKDPKFQYSLQYQPGVLLDYHFVQFKIKDERLKDVQEYQQALQAQCSPVTIKTKKGSKPN